MLHSLMNEVIYQRHSKAGSRQSTRLPAVCLCVLRDGSACFATPLMLLTPVSPHQINPPTSCCAHTTLHLLSTAAHALGMVQAGPSLCFGVDAG